MKIILSKIHCKFIAFIPFVQPRKDIIHAIMKVVNLFCETILVSLAKHIGLD
jgi:hypothetical protein